MSNIKFKVGDKVKYIGKNHEEDPEFYPVVGTVGLIKRYEGLDKYLIEWEKGSTSYNDCWYCDGKNLTIADEKKKANASENIKMTNEEIWEMLWPKMEKNGLKPKMGGIYTSDGFIPGYQIYSMKDVHNAIAIAYRSGYERAMKGRPFKIGEKKAKKGGHWEPVDPDNLPKEGTKVRYTRESEEYAKEPGMINVGDIGIFSYGKILGVPGIRFDDGRFWNWISFSNEIDCLDMWVEDDE